jgi:hypothetical protein
MGARANTRAIFRAQGDHGRFEHELVANEIVEDHGIAVISHDVGLVRGDREVVVLVVPRALGASFFGGAFSVSAAGSLRGRRDADSGDFRALSGTIRTLTAWSTTTVTGFRQRAQGIDSSAFIAP